MSQLVDLLRRRPWRLAAVVVALLVVGVGVANRDLLRIAVTPTETIDQKLPVARPVDAREGEVVYRIDAADSLVTVTVEEELAGVGHEVELTTSGIAGEIAVGGIADGNPSVNIGEVVVDVAQLRSDNSLRDKVLRHEYLESHRHPQVRLGGASVSLGETVDGPGDRIEVDGASLSATLDVKGVGHPVTFDVDAVLDGDELSGVATATVSLAELGVGPIVKAGLVRTSNEARIELEVVARATPDPSTSPPGWSPIARSAPPTMKDLPRPSRPMSSRSSSRTARAVTRRARSAHPCGSSRTPETRPRWPTGWLWSPGPATCRRGPHRT
ncbi:MAG: YceI family protein [Microthrixaceae bacterium]